MNWKQKMLQLAPMAPTISYLTISATHQLPVPDSILLNQKAFDEESSHWSNTFTSKSLVLKTIKDFKHNPHFEYTFPFRLCLICMFRLIISTVPFILMMKYLHSHVRASWLDRQSLNRFEFVAVEPVKHCNIVALVITYCFLAFDPLTVLSGARL